jgi:spore coat polysaccharide biosynthesis protein SpsF
MMQALGQPMLYHLVTRLKAASSIDAIVLATTTSTEDEILADFSKVRGIQCYRGSEDDVMERVIDAAESVAADLIVEITGDCPIIDPQSGGHW